MKKYKHTLVIAIMVLGQTVLAQTTTHTNETNHLKVTTPHGYVQIGPQNSSFSHFSTDVEKFYFNKPIYVNGSIHSYTGNNLNLGTYGKNQIIVLESNGNVGIGSTNPTSKLHIQDNFATGWLQNVKGGATNVDQFIGIKLSAGFSTEYSKWGGIATVVESSYANNTGLALYANETERLRISSNGNVGVGTATVRSGYKMQINGGLVSTSSNGTSNGQISFRGDRDDSRIFEENYKLNMISANGLIFDYDANVNNGGAFEIKDGGVSRLKINELGNVGVGTATVRSGYKMQINGGLVSTSSNRTSNGQISFRGDRDDSRIFEENYKLNMTSANGLIFDYDANVNNGGAFEIKDGGVSRLKINELGNVGIGKLTPTAKLHVAGNIISTEIKVEDVDGADFVFAPNYNLMPLTEIETYIKQNHHLPEVPSAAEMQANGVELGKMNMLLLQKIEELTLLMIEQQKEIKKQNERIIKLEEK